MEPEWTITLTRDEALVLSDFLDRAQQANNYATEDEAEIAALNALLGLLERADDGTVFASNYAVEVEAARARLRLQP
jgi:hypothetical protein